MSMFFTSCDSGAFQKQWDTLAETTPTENATIVPKDLWVYNGQWFFLYENLDLARFHSVLYDGDVVQDDLTILDLSQYEVDYSFHEGEFLYAITLTDNASYSYITFTDKLVTPNKEIIEPVYINYPTPVHDVAIADSDNMYYSINDERGHPQVYHIYSQTDPIVLGELSYSPAATVSNAKLAVLNGTVYLLYKETFATTESWKLMEWDVNAQTWTEAYERNFVKGSVQSSALEYDDMDVYVVHYFDETLVEINGAQTDISITKSFDGNISDLVFEGGVLYVATISPIEGKVFSYKNEKWKELGTEPIFEVATTGTPSIRLATTYSGVYAINQTASGESIRILRYVQ